MTGPDSRRALSGAVALAGTLAMAGPALADIAGPDDSIQQAFGPMSSGSSYSGAFVSPGDVDYLAIAVARPNTMVHVDVENTVAACASPNLTGCPIWGSLIDGQGGQVGGEGSTAGTGEVDAGASDVIDWTFSAAGTYYLAIDSSGDLPTYRVRETAIEPGLPGGAPAGSPGSAGGQPGSGPAGGTTTGGHPSTGQAVTLALSRHQRGDTIRARLVVRRPVRLLTLSVTTPSSRLLASARLTSVPVGRRTVALRLGRAGRGALVRAGRLRLTVRLVAQPVTGGPQSTVRSTTLGRPVAR
ncbi:MAG TPA: hypothetical protein VFR49_06855 [Solirubrobacteraceae bacterium]|nr:hypothetical protein [Solirubrobacteraceae bacterium]